MPPRLLLDTHILLRWLADSRRLSPQQSRVVEKAVKRGESVAISAMTLLEIAILAGGNKLSLHAILSDLFDEIRGNPVFRVLPLTFEVAQDAASLGVLRDPADRTIAATARVHRLQLVTSDLRIIESKLVPVVE